MEDKGMHVLARGAAMHGSRVPCSMQAFCEGAVFGLGLVASSFLKVGRLPPGVKAASLTFLQVFFFQLPPPRVLLFFLFIFSNLFSINSPRLFLCPSP